MSKKSFLSVLLLPACLVWASGQTRDAAAERQVRKRVEQFSQAFVRADAVALAPLLAEDYMHTNANGSVLGKSQWLAYIATRKTELETGRLTLESYANEDVQVRIYGATAVVTGMNRARGKRDGQAFQTRLRFTHVWVYRRGKWLRAAFHDSAVAP